MYTIKRLFEQVQDEKQHHELDAESFAALHEEANKTH